MEFSDADFTRVVPNAYHGTDLASASSIINYGFRISESEKLHFGDGVYFYDGNIEYAKDWARQKTSSGDKIGVIMASIEMARCLDLHHSEVWDLIETVKEGFAQNYGDDVPLPVIINHIAERHDVDTVRGVQQSRKRGRISQDFPYYRQTKIIICVKNLDNIDTYSLVYQGS